MSDRSQGGDVIELRRPKTARVNAAARASAHAPLFDHLQALGLIDTDQFAQAIDDLADLRRRCGQDSVHRQATANLLAAIVTLRCGLGFDVIGKALEAAVAENDRMRRRI